MFKILGLTLTLGFISCSKETALSSKDLKKTSDENLLSPYLSNDNGVIFIQAHKSNTDTFPPDRVWGHITSTIDYGIPISENNTLTFGKLHVNNHVLSRDGNTYSISDDLIDIFDGDSATVVISDSLGDLQNSPSNLNAKIYGPKPFEVAIPDLISPNSILTWNVDSKCENRVYIEIVYNGFHHQPNGTPQVYKQQFIEGNNIGKYALTESDLNTLPDGGLVQIRIAQISVKWISLKADFDSIEIPIVAEYSVNGISTIKK